MKPLILALDTTGGPGSLALVRGDAVIEERLLESPDGFAHVIHNEIAAMLARNGMALGDVDAFAAAAGPGSFTGVRVGLACVKGLAEAMGKPAFGVSNLRALASFAEAHLRGGLIDARRGEVYGAVYDASGAVVVEETVGKLAEWLGRLPEGDIEIAAANGFTLSISRQVMYAPAAIAGAVARIAAALYAGGDRPDPATLDANYVRRSDAELFWKDV